MFSDTSTLDLTTHQIETVGTTGNDTIPDQHTAASTTSWTAREGNDTLNSGSGNDTYFSPPAHDTIYGPGGTDSLLYGVGIFRVYLSVRPAA